MIIKCKCSDVSIYLHTNTNFILKNFNFPQHSLHNDGIARYSREIFYNYTTAEQ